MTTSVIEKIATPTIAKLFVNASGWKVLPSCPVKANTGMNDRRMIITEKKIGRAEVRSLFNVPKLGTIAGSAVTEGVVKRGAHVRVVRERKVVHASKVSSLRRIKDDVKEVATGFECGIGCDRFSSWQEGDRIEAYKLVTQRRTLST